MIGAIAGWSVRHRGLVIGVTLALAFVGAAVGSRLDLDALQDVTTNQVVVLTSAPGLTPEEVERFVSRRIETAIGGSPGLIEQRSLSRYGISSVSAIFGDEVDPYRARQIIQERLSSVAAELPPSVGAPQLAPLTGGLGEIFHFTLSSPQRTPAELLELATFRVLPLLRAVPGVVEVNSWGGAQRTLDVVVDTNRLAQRKLTLSDVKEALMHATGTVPGASVPAGSAQVLLRGMALPRDAGELSAAVVRAGDAATGAPPVRVGDVATVVPGTLPRLGAATSNGRGETVYLMVQMLRGANALEVMGLVHEQMPALRKLLPSDVAVDVVYDRSVLVTHTLKTVARNLVEGGVLVVVVLLLMLGSLRAGLIVASAIPLSMLGAVAGMVALGIPGNLMSLGAIDFGLLVDGAVVMVEALFHRMHGQRHAMTGREQVVETIGQAAGTVARPVFFSVLVIVLVYVPILTMTGVDGKMFRPMAVTVVLALVTSLVLSLTWIPAASAALLRPEHVPQRDPLLMRLVDRLYQPLLGKVTTRPFVVGFGAALLLAAGALLFHRSGVEFAPQLDEGDIVIQTTRAPDISIESAVEQAGRFERAVLRSAPEVLQIVSRIGSPAVATDIMGIEQGDVFVKLKPRDEWRPGLTREQLVAEIEAALGRDAPGGEPSFTQPIQMRFNELLGGAVSDVAVSLYGEDLDELRGGAEAVARVVAQVQGAADVRLLAPPSVNLLDVRPRPLDASRVGLTAGDILETVQAVRAGVEVGATWDGPVRLPILLRATAHADAFTLKQLPVPLPGGGVLPLERVADVRSEKAAALVNRQDAQRRLVVGFNVRGATLGDVVREAQRRVDAEVTLPTGIRVVWGGQFQQLEEAGRRLMVVIPLVLLIIVVVLVLTFERLRPALILLAHVPFAMVGGVAALALRGLPLSVSAAVGFIALSGIAVLNGVVLMTKLLSYEHDGLSPAEAARRAAQERARPVLMTALVAALGFVPMMLATGIGSEVQRPLATVVVGGLLTSTLLTLVVLPTLYPWAARRRADA